MAADMPTGFHEMMVKTFVDDMEDLLNAPTPFGRYEYKPWTRRQRIAYKVRAAREAVALRIAPWLDREDW